MAYYNLQNEDFKLSPVLIIKSCETERKKNIAACFPQRYSQAFPQQYLHIRVEIFIRGLFVVDKVIQQDF